MKSDVEKLHKNTLVADLHCDTVIQMKRGYDLAERHDNYHIDIPRLKEGGVDLQVFAAYAHPFVDGKSQFEVADEYINILSSEISRNHDQTMICRNSSDIIRAVHGGKIASLMAIENGAALENNPENLGYFFEKGVRLITLAHEESTNWCISWSDIDPTFQGLSNLGREIVEEMNRLGMIIDISHCAASSADEVIKISRQPVIASHSCAYGLCPSARNLTDNQIRAIADRGGLIGITLVYFLLSPELNNISTEHRNININKLQELSKLFVSFMPEEEMQEEFKKYDHFIRDFENLMEPHRPTVRTVVDHIEYVINLVGVDYVGIGSDFDGMSFPPLGLEDCSDMPNLTEELVRRGYSDNDIKKIMGGNFLRVIEDVCG